MFGNSLFFKAMILRTWSFAAVCTAIFVLTSCNDSAVENLTDYSGDTLQPAIVAQVSWEDEAAPPIDSAILAKLKPCDGFDYPVGPPNAKRYFKARGFLPIGIEHLGEDWNGQGGGNTDFGDFVYSAADGIVFFSQYVNPGWGNVIRIIHNYGTAEHPRYIETLYAHVSSSLVRPGWPMDRGDKIGTIGNANGKYHAHLHFEMRKKPAKEIRCGYDGDTLGFTDPTPFIEAHRPMQKK
jgi:hypothetical protein